eukprot:TRINITY_DN10453_c0_g1_i2.p4 TRINITY_DN10453_c0_g1~~TRINITY_DN10453_c0_g1_i2.p4  ORF type:complete len:120 (-),score=16.63 TRINITY_DN10453_c0_g1_i2:341-649(-)
MATEMGGQEPKSAFHSIAKALGLRDAAASFSEFTDRFCNCFSEKERALLGVQERRFRECGLRVDRVDFDESCAGRKVPRPPACLPAPVPCPPRSDFFFDAER